MNVKLFLPDVDAVNKFVKSVPSVALCCQIVSGHTRLNEFVHRILGLNEFVHRILGLKASSLCECQQRKETIAHFLFECSLYDEQRSDIWDDFQPSYEFITRDWQRLKEFVKKTRRFEGRIRKEELDKKGKRALVV